MFGPQSTYTITANGLLQSPNGLLRSAEVFRPIVLAYRNGRPVRLDQVANVLDSVEALTQRAWLYTKTGVQRVITLQVQKQPGTNVIEVTDRVRAVLPALEAQLPPSVHLSIRQDRSKTIRQAFSDIQITMLITLVLVVGVIFVFLHNGSATLIPALALPFSILGTFAMMKMMNYSLDNLSMMALILSIGFVVDDAIVMLENIVRHMESRRAAARSVAQGLEGNRLHDSDDDDVARRRLHSDSVHGRHSRPPVPRVRGHDHHRHSHLGRRVGHADADALQPLPERSSTSRPGSRASWTAASSGCSTPTREACASSCGTARP